MPSPFGFRFDNSYRRLPEPLFSDCSPQPVSTPAFALFNDALARELGLDSEALSTHPEFSVAMHYWMAASPLPRLMRATSLAT